MRYKVQLVFKSVWVAIVACVLVAGWASSVAAQQSSSPNYQVNETFFGMGGQDTCTDLVADNQYCALVTAGELTIGNTKSAQYQAYGGFNTERSPFIEVSIVQPFVDLGVVGVDNTGVGTAQFQVKAYLAHGYVVQIYGPSLTNQNRVIPAMSTLGTSQKGTEQFGINLTANTIVPGSANPEQDVDGTFSYGKTSDGTNGLPVYNLADNFKYVSGDIVAYSQSSTSYTKYTVSYLMNAAAVTPAGLYTTEHSVVATGTY